MVISALSDALDTRYLSHVNIIVAFFQGKEVSLNFIHKLHFGRDRMNAQNLNRYMIVLPSFGSKKFSPVNSIGAQKVKKVPEGIRSGRYRAARAVKNQR